MKVLNPEILNAITQDLKFTHMMPVQAATVDDLLSERNDCLVQARTGTGKTLGFLLPAIQSALDANRISQKSVSCLILSPTRELALQIAAEAKSLTQRLPQFRIATSIGGTNKTTEARHLAATILVATPGRLIDHMSEGYAQGLFNQLQTLVLDEADRMLDMGFLPDIKRIIAQLPDKKARPRHSMLFSATMDDKVKTIAGTILNKDYKFISTIPKGESQTHDRVPQFSMVVPSMSDLAPALVSVITKEAASTKPFKAIVFAPTIRVADLYGHLLANTAGLPPTSVLHSRMTQSKRTNITNQFRVSEDAICVATDVIARGMDFPSVTHVFQVGLPMDRESYIHRLGRTARADASGRGVLILSQPESFFLRTLKGININQYEDIPLAYEQVSRSVATLENKGGVYSAVLGYYKTSIKQLQWSPAELVRQANVFAVEGLGCPEIPPLERSTVGKMGLKGVPGLVIVANLPRDNHHGHTNGNGNGNAPKRGGGNHATRGNGNTSGRGRGGVRRGRS